MINLFNMFPKIKQMCLTHVTVNKILRQIIYLNTHKKFTVGYQILLRFMQMFFITYWLKGVKD